MSRTFKKIVFSIFLVCVYMWVPTCSEAETGYQKIIPHCSSIIFIQEKVSQSNPEFTNMVSLVSQLALGIPPSEAGITGRPLCIP